MDRITDLGTFIRINFAGIGHAAKMFVVMLGRSIILFKRFRLVADQIFFLGNYSFVIIAVSGLFV